MATPNNKGLPIDITADTKFIQEIQARITVSGRLPFSVPTDHIPIHISDAAKYFYKHYYDGFETRRYVICESDIDRSNSVPTVRLPDYFVDVTDLKEVSGGMGEIVSLRSPSLLMLNPFGFNDFINGTMSGYPGINGNFESGFYYDYGTNSSDAILSLYSASITEAMFRKYVTYRYNEDSNNLQIIGSFSGNLMIEVSEGLELKYLYKNSLFVKYVTGLCLLNLKSILGTFAFQMPGNIEINYQDYADRGQALVDEVNQSFEDEMPGDIFLVN